jgi:hypothetical protein
MKAVAAILLLAMTGGVLADTAKPMTGDNADKPYIYDSARKFFDGRHPYLDDRLQMRRLKPSGFRSDALEMSPDSAKDEPMPEKAPAAKSPG